MNNYIVDDVFGPNLWTAVMADPSKLLAKAKAADAIAMYERKDDSENNGSYLEINFRLWLSYSGSFLFASQPWQLRLQNLCG